MSKYLVVEDRIEMTDVDLDKVAAALVDARDPEDAIRETGIYGRLLVYELDVPLRFDAALKPIITAIDPTPIPRPTLPDRPRNVNDLKPTVELPDLGKL